MDDVPKPTPYPRPAATGDAPPRPRRRPLRTAGRALLALVSVAALATTGYAWATYHEVQGNVHTTDALDLPADKPAPPADDGGEDILLVGTDARTDMQGNALPPQVLKTLRTEQTSGVNTDTIIVVRLPKNGAKPYAVSIPRDTWIDVPRGGQGKINSVYGPAKQAKADELRRQGRRDAAGIERDSDQAGRQALVQAVQDFTQVRIDHYAEVNLLGFYLITESLGGVQVCLNHATEDKDSGADFRAGVQTVSGGAALSFVRQRKNLPRGDLDRIVRQQAFLSSALHQVLSAGVLANPGTLGDLADALHRSLVLDPGFDLLQFAEKAKGLATGDVTFTTIPVITINGRSPDGQQSVVEADPVAVRQFFAGLAGRSAGAGGGGAPGGGVAQAVPAGVSCVN
ncbi:LCP family protein [Amycolatopsis granulosa]|uniref:LCP family protein n=1 Tax=Amycolatopsis granulosa TaxID=185684 RepID=UPI0014229973|nr:LCP family protein [Amycolatopsis granulosa]NIH85457.1 LCP family protein required for cell wall assembly [Amycolatopsis granulosa]